jgi:hypothetical protein
MFSGIELCVDLKIFFFQAIRIARFGGLNLFFFNVLLSELIV